MFGIDDILGIGAGLLGGFMQSKGGDKQQQALQGMSQADRDFYERMYGRSLSDNRANQYSDFGSLTWNQDPTTGKWSQTTSLNPAEQGRLADYRQIAADRMRNAMGMSANLPQGAMNWNAIGLGNIASAAGVQGGGNSDATADARAGMGIVGQPGWTRQNPLIGGNGRYMPMQGQQGPMGFGPQMGAAGGGFLGGQAPTPQGNSAPPPGPAGLPGGRVPYTPAPITAEPAAPAPGPQPPTGPAAPAAPQVPDMSANLQAYLNSGHSVMTPEMMDHFGGDDMMKYVKSIDPNAKWTRTSTYGGEGGEGPMGQRLDFDPRLLSQLLKGGQ